MIPWRKSHVDVWCLIKVPFRPPEDALSQTKSNLFLLLLLLPQTLMALFLFQLVLTKIIIDTTTLRQPSTSLQLKIMRARLSDPATIRDMED